MKELHEYIEIAEEVKTALHEKRGVVALETTIISHGMPYPENVKMANTVESIIREHGATPATIAIIEGKIKIGLTGEELEFMATDKNIVKASRRDIPIAVSKGLNAATTVAGTMICANLAGVRVFATGGIGGVHRGAEKSFDISADLQELAKTNVAVISAGAKSILDLQLTLEYLETMGVPVIGYRTDEFPAFYTRESGLRVSYRMDSPAEIARMLHYKWEMGIEGGAVIANPIPEKHSMNRDEIESVINETLIEADKKKIRGKELTPFLLDRIKEITGGKSLKANLELVYNNASLAAQIAVELAGFQTRNPQGKTKSRAN